MQAILKRLVPEFFRDKQHLAVVRKRLIGLLILMLALLIATITSFIVVRELGIVIKIDVLATLAATLITSYYLFQMLSGLSIVNTSAILNVIDACDADSSGRTSIAASGFIAEYYGNQGFLTRSQFDCLKIRLRDADGGMGAVEFGHSF